MGFLEEGVKKRAEEVEKAINHRGSGARINPRCPAWVAELVLGIVEPFDTYGQKLLALKDSAYFISKEGKSLEEIRRIATAPGSLHNCVKWLAEDPEGAAEYCRRADPDDEGLHSLLCAGQRLENEELFDALLAELRKLCGGHNG